MENCFNKLNDLVMEGHDMNHYIWSGKLVPIGNKRASVFTPANDDRGACWNGNIEAVKVFGEKSFGVKKMFSAFGEVAEALKDCKEGDYVFVLAEVRAEMYADQYRDKGIIVAVDILS